MPSPVGCPTDVDAQLVIDPDAVRCEAPFMNCRPGCGACCTAPSITSPIPGMPNGKPAGVRCVQLGDDERCRIFGQPERPAFCASLQPEPDMCGTSRDDALMRLTRLETLTRPGP